VLEEKRKVKKNVGTGDEKRVGESSDLKPRGAQLGEAGDQGEIIVGVLKNVYQKGVGRRGGPVVQPVCASTYGRGGRPGGGEQSFTRN